MNFVSKSYDANVGQWNPFCIAHMKNTRIYITYGWAERRVRESWKGRNNSKMKKLWNLLNNLPISALKCKELLNHQSYPYNSNKKAEQTKSITCFGPIKEIEVAEQYTISWNLERDRWIQKIIAKISLPRHKLMELSHEQEREK